MQQETGFQPGGKMLCKIRLIWGESTKCARIYTYVAMKLSSRAGLAIDTYRRLSSIAIYCDLNNQSSGLACTINRKAVQYN